MGNRELERQAEDYKKKLRDVEEEGRLGREELELRLAAVARNENDNSHKYKEFETKLSKLTGDNRSLTEQLEKCRQQLSSFEKIKNSLNEIKAEKIILEEQIKGNKQELQTNQGKITELEMEKDSFSAKLNEKHKELSECLESMAKMEDSIREQKEKVEHAEFQLSIAHEEHKQNLENLKLQIVESNENTELNQVGILLEKHKTEIEEKNW